MGGIKTIRLSLYEMIFLMNTQLKEEGIKTTKYLYRVMFKKVGSVEKERPGVMAPFDYSGLKGQFG